MLKYFASVKTLEGLKKVYKRLALIHHPDRGGDAEIMKAINAEYEAVFERVKNTHENKDGKTYTTKTETTEPPEQFRDIINKIIALEGIKIEVCGSWVWVTGNTYPHREILKATNFQFSRQKSAWYFRPAEYHKKSRKILTLDEIRNFYGSTEIESKPQRTPKLQTA